MYQHLIIAFTQKVFFLRGGEKGFTKKRAKQKGGNVHTNIDSKK